MKFTKERAMYAGILGVGLLALIVDRAVLAPSGASAALPDGVPGETPASDARKADAVAGLASNASRGPGLAARLRADDEAWLVNVRDGFRAAESWIAQPQIEAPADTAPDEVRIFVQSHKLTAVNGSSTDRPRIIVNGKVLKMGDEIDGWELVEVTGGSAAFQKREMSAVLNLSVRGLPMKSRQQDESGEHGPPAPEQEPGAAAGSGER